MLPRSSRSILFPVVALSAVHNAIAFAPATQARSMLRAPAPSLNARPLAFAGPSLRGFRSMSMGLLDSLKKTLGGDLPQRGYDDLVEGTWSHEAAQLALEDKVSPVDSKGNSIAMFGGGCFWGVELSFQRVPGVIDTSVGYAQAPEGGPKHPIYELVCTGMTGHTEVVSLTYDPKEVEYKDLCRLLFSRIDPSLKDQVGNDRGTQYRHGIYTYTEQQAKDAQEVFDEIKASGAGPIYTELEPAKVYYPAEEYHQQYLAKGGRGGNPQSAAKMCTDPIRCYG